jgi:hypothetical protein
MIALAIMVVFRWQITPVTTNKPNDPARMYYRFDRWTGRVALCSLGDSAFQDDTIAVWRCFTFTARG